MFRAFASALADSEAPLSIAAPVPRARGLVVLALAICALLIGMFPRIPIELLQIGRHSTRGSRCHDSRIPARWRYRPAACHVVCVRFGKAGGRT